MKKAVAITIRTPFYVKHIVFDEYTKKSWCLFGKVQVTTTLLNFNFRFLPSILTDLVDEAASLARFPTLSACDSRTSHTDSRAVHGIHSPPTSQAAHSASRMAATIWPSQTSDAT